MYIAIVRLLKDRNWTAYDLAKRIEKLGVSDQAVYRLVRAKGRFKRIDMRLLGALIEVFGEQAWRDGEILVLDKPIPPSSPRDRRKR